MAQMHNMFTVSPKKAYDETFVCLRAGIVPLLLSSPGMGKSSIARDVARDANLKLIDLRMATMLPEDLNGFPLRKDNKATFTPFDTFPLENDEVPEGYDGWLLFLDEFTSMPKQVQGAAYKLVLDRMVGSYHLHPNVAIMAAGNLLTDKAVVHQLSTAMQSRVTTYELKLDPKEWVEHVSYRIGVDHRVTAFINYMPSRLMVFDPEHQDKTFPCPRTWEMVSKLIQDEKHITEDLGPRIAGTIGEGTAVEFITFAKVFSDLHTYDDVIAHPTTVPIPDEPSTKYAMVSMMIEKTKPEDLARSLTYIKRFDPEFQMITAIGLTQRHQMLRRQPDFRQFLASISAKM